MAAKYEFSKFDYVRITVGLAFAIAGLVTVWNNRQDFNPLLANVLLVVFIFFIVMFVLAYVAVHNSLSSQKKISDKELRYFKKVH